jgi:tetratricopeptide (TPR) repeat protein
MSKYFSLLPILFLTCSTANATIISPTNDPVASSAYITTIDNGRFIIARESEAEESHIKRGRAFDEMQQYPEALASFNNALKANPQSVRAYLSRGSVYLSMKQYDNAKSDWQKAAQLYQQQGDKARYEGTISLLKQLEDHRKKLNR